MVLETAISADADYIITGDKDLLVLEEFEIPYEIKIVSAHRTPDVMAEYGKTAASRGLKVIIAGAGGAGGIWGISGTFYTAALLSFAVSLFGVILIREPEVVKEC